MEIKDIIRDKIQIEHYISQYTQLKSVSSVKLCGLCPFHREKTPSFYVDSQKNFYYCFGCKRGGDLFSFVMDYDDVGFAEAIKKLCSYANIDYQATQGKSRQEYQILHEILSVIQGYCTHSLNDQRAQFCLRYLKKREISEKAQANFRLGVLIGSDIEKWMRDWLSRLSIAKNLTHEQLVKYLRTIGILQNSQYSQTKEYWSPYADRLMLPLVDESGKICGFGGRICFENSDKPKYINGRETAVFHKRDYLYGLAQNRDTIRQSRLALLVEGYLDVIALWQNHIPYACASLGSAVNLGHLQKISKYADTIVFVFDGDEAGRASALRLAPIILNSESTLRIKVLPLPAGYDPADLATVFNKIQLDMSKDSNFEFWQDFSVPFMDYLLMETMQPSYFNNLENLSIDKQSANLPEELVKFLTAASSYYSRTTSNEVQSFQYPTGMEKMIAIQRIYDILAEVKDEVQQHILLEQSSKFLAIKTELLILRWQKNRKQHQLSRKNQKALQQSKKYTIPENQSLFKQNGKSLTKLDRIEREIIYWLLHFPQFWQNFYKKIVDFKIEDYQSYVLFRSLEIRAENGQMWHGDELLDWPIGDQAKSVFFAMQAKNPPQASTAKQVLELLTDLFLQWELVKLKASVKSYLMTLQNLSQIVDNQEEEEHKIINAKLKRLNEIRSQIRNKEMVAN